MRIRWSSVAALVMVATLGGAGCADPAADGAATDYPLAAVTFSAGAERGSGLDLTMRAFVDVLEREDVTDARLEVENHPGGASATWTAEMVEKHAGEGDQVSVASLVTMTNHASGASDYDVDDLTMIARLLTEHYVVVARAGSQLDTLRTAVDAVIDDPASVPVGAASDDQLAFALLVEAAGGDASRVRFVPYEGGAAQGEALLAGKIELAIAGTSEVLGLIEARQLQGLGVLSEQPLAGLDVPTARSQGLDVTLANWRGIYGPPQMPEKAVRYWRDVAAEALATDAWAEIAASNRWTTAYLSGDALDRYLRDTHADVVEAFTALEPDGR